MSYGDSSKYNNKLAGDWQHGRCHKQKTKEHLQSTICLGVENKCFMLTPPKRMKMVRSSDLYILLKKLVNKYLGRKSFGHFLPELGRFNYTSQNLLSINHSVYQPINGRIIKCSSNHKVIFDDCLLRLTFLTSTRPPSGLSTPAQCCKRVRGRAQTWTRRGRGLFLPGPSLLSSASWEGDVD